MPWALLIVAAGIAVLIESEGRRDESIYRYTIDSLKARVAYAETQRQTDSVQVIRYVRRTQFDTTRLTDTAYVTSYVARVDTLRERCLACVGSASQVAEQYRAERDFWQTRYNAVKPTTWTVAKPYVFGALGVYVGQRIGCAR